MPQSPRGCLPGPPSERHLGACGLNSETTAHKALQSIHSHYYSHSFSLCHPTGIGTRGTLSTAKAQHQSSKARMKSSPGPSWCRTTCVRRFFTTWVVQVVRSMVGAFNSRTKNMSQWDQSSQRNRSKTTAQERQTKAVTQVGPSHITIMLMR